MNMLLPILLVIAAALLVAAVRRVPNGRVYSVYRGGKLIRVLEEGTHLVLPLRDRVMHKIDLAGQTLRLEESLDEARDLRGTVYWQVLEPERADAVIDEVNELIRRGAREVLRSQPATAHGNHRDLGAQVKQSLNSALRQRGMMVTRVELEAA